MKKEPSALTSYVLWYFFAKGVVSSENQYPPSSGRQEEYLSLGPMCRYAEDLKPMLKIMAGPNANMWVPLTLHRWIF